MTAKEVLMDIANRLPENATLADAAYELELRAALVEGIASLDRGEGMPLGEVEKMLPEWISSNHFASAENPPLMILRRSETLST